MYLSYAAQNIISGATLAAMVFLILKGRTFDALMVMLVGILCAPLSVIGAQRVSFTYFASGVLLIYVLLNAGCLRAPRNGLVVLLTLLIYSQFLVKLLSTGIFTFANAPSEFGWTRLLGQLHVVIVYLLSVMLAYNEPISHAVKDGDRLSSKMLSALGIAMVLNLFAVCLQLASPSHGFRLINTWYSSGSRTTIQSVEQMGRFLRFYGLNYSPVILGFKSVLALAAGCFHTLTIGDSRTKRKALMVIGLSAVNGILSFTKTFVVGSVICVFCCWLYAALHRITDLSKVSIRTVGILGACFFVLFALISINTDRLQMATGLPFGYYFGKIVRSPLDAFASRYRYDLSPQDAQVMLKVIRGNLALGVGISSATGEFIGDSDYLVTLHDGGLIALLLMLMEIGLVLYWSWAKQRHMFFGAFFATAVAGFALPTLSTDLGLFLLGVFAGYVARPESGWAKRG